MSNAFIKNVDGNCGAVAITPSDATIYSPPLQCINVTVSGVLALVFTDATAATISLAAGSMHRICNVTQVKATGTTATGITGFLS